MKKKTKPKVCNECQVNIKKTNAGDICYYCGLMHPNVEAGGMWYCPNLLCSGPGAGWFRSTLESYEENSNGSHTVDSNEWIYKAKKYIKENPDKKNVLILWDET